MEKTYTISSEKWNEKKIIEEINKIKPNSPITLTSTFKVTTELNETEFNKVLSNL